MVLQKNKFYTHVCVHINPVKFRFVSCATNSFRCHASKIFFNLLNKILIIIDEKGNSFIIYNNKSVLDYINYNNPYIKSINTHDFENLFANISIAILLRFVIIYMMNFFFSFKLW